MPSAAEVASHGPQDCRERENLTQTLHMEQSSQQEGCRLCALTFSSVVAGPPGLSVNTGLVEWNPSKAHPKVSTCLELRHWPLDGICRHSRLLQP